MTRRVRELLTKARVAPWPVTTLFVVNLGVSIVSLFSLSLAMGERAARQDEFESQATSFARYTAEADLRLCERLKSNRNELRNLVGGVGTEPLPIPPGADAALRAVIQDANSRAVVQRAQALARPDLAPIDCRTEQRIVDGDRMPSEGGAS